MKKFINQVENVEQEMLAGIAKAHPNHLRKLPENTVLVRSTKKEGKVALISGGGSGHEPAHGGFVGTGIMGAPICEHLLDAGYRLYVHNRTREKAERLVERGAVWCDTPADAAREADVTFTMVGYPTDVEDVYLGKNGILGVAMGSSEAVGYVDMKGRMTGRISELAFAPVDFNPKAPKCEWSGDAGVGAMAFSQQAVNWLAQKYGFRFPKEMALPERLKVVQAAMEKGDEKALQVYIQIGRFLAHAIPWYNEFYDYENMMILGRVTSGLGGSVILETAKAMLKDVYPEWSEKIDIFMPDEKARRLGQSVAAAQIPVIKKR